MIDLKNVNVAYFQYFYAHLNSIVVIPKSITVKIKSIYSTRKFI